MKPLYYLMPSPNVSGPHCSQRLDFADRWLKDALEVCGSARGFCTLEINMTHFERWAKLSAVRHQKIHFPAAIARAAAVAISRHPGLKKMVVANRRYFPEHVDISMSVAGETFIAPIMRLKNVDTKGIIELGTEIEQRVKKMRENDSAMLGRMRRWGWVVPLGWARRAIFKLLMQHYDFRKEAGLLQLSYLPDVDLAVPLKFTAPVMLAFGSIKQRVIAVNNQPRVCPTLILTGLSDHVAWDGMCLSRFLGEMRSILESESVEDILR